MAHPTKPTYRVYTVQEREDAEDYWTAIGAAFEHRDKKGMNIVLQALPLDGRLVLRSHSDPPAQADR